MLRFSTLAAIVLTGALVTLIWNIQPESKCANGLIHEAPSGEKVQAMVTSYACFKHTFTASLRGLRSGEIGLEEACTRVRDSADLHFPDFLKHIELSERGSSDQDRIARNLIGHLRHIEGGDVIQQYRVLALEVEFAELKRRAAAPIGPPARQ